MLLGSPMRTPHAAGIWEGRGRERRKKRKRNWIPKDGQSQSSELCFPETSAAWLLSNHPTSKGSPDMVPAEGTDLLFQRDCKHILVLAALQQNFSEVIRVQRAWEGYLRMRTSLAWSWLLGITMANLSSPCIWFLISSWHDATITRWYPQSLQPWVGWSHTEMTKTPYRTK